MRIAVVGPLRLPNPQGGMSRHCEELYSRIAARGHDVTVYCASRSGDGPSSYRGMKLRWLRASGLAGLDRIRCGLAAAVASLRGRYDIVHFHSLTSSAPCFVPRLGRAKVVVTVHRLEWRDEKWGPIGRAVLRASEWLVMRCAHAVIAVSRNLEADLARRYPRARPPRYVANGVLVPESDDRAVLGPLGLGENEYALFVGRLTPEKGVDVLLDAFELLWDDANAATRCELAIVGDAPKESDYARQLRARGARLAAPVRFLGLQHDDSLAALFANARLYVTASHQEGQPLAVLEAMSCGRCVVASDIPAHRELLGPAGVMVADGNAKDFAVAVARLLADDSAIERYGNAARRRITDSDEFDWDRTATETEQILLAA